MPGPNPSSLTFGSSVAAFFGGVRTAWTSVFAAVMAGTYIGLGALAHDFGLSAFWMMLSTLLVWAGPAQLVLISGIGTGAAMIEVALAVSLSGIRLFPMVVALLPLVRTRDTRLRDLLLPTHFTSVSMWIESLRILPGMAVEHRLAFCNGLSVAFIGCAVTFGFVGYYLAAGLPPILAATLLVAGIAPSQARAQVVEPNGTSVPGPSSDPNETSLQSFFDKQGEAINAVKEASIEPGTFSPLCDFEAALVLSQSNAQAGIAW